MTRATSFEIDQAQDAGRLAFREKRPAAPGADATIRGMIADAKVGDPRSVALMRAFQYGYDDARRLAARKYRMVRAEVVGYTGPSHAHLWQVQYQDPGMPWFDQGDPLDKDLATARLQALRG